MTDQLLWARTDLATADCRDNANPALITGERGSGKTSLLYRLASALEGGQAVPVRAVFFDLAGLHAHEFYETAIRTISKGCDRT